jgi:hypothetical protein
MMLNIRDLLFHPNRYVRNFAVGLEDVTTRRVDGTSTYELGAPGRVGHSHQRSGVAFAHSNNADLDWAISLNSHLPALDSSKGTSSTPTTDILSPASIEEEKVDNDDADSGKIVFADSPTYSTPDTCIRPLKTIFEGATENVQPSLDE